MSFLNVCLKYIFANVEAQLHPVDEFAKFDPSFPRFVGPPYRISNFVQAGQIPFLLSSRATLSSEYVERTSSDSAHQLALFSVFMILLLSKRVHDPTKETTDRLNGSIVRFCPGLQAMKSATRPRHITAPRMRKLAENGARAVSYEKSPENPQRRTLSSDFC